jgi:hypothetical protein
VPGHLSVPIGNLAVTWIALVGTSGILPGGSARRPPSSGKPHPNLRLLRRVWCAALFMLVVSNRQPASWSLGADGGEAESRRPACSLWTLRPSMQKEATACVPMFSRCCWRVGSYWD